MLKFRIMYINKLKKIKFTISLVYILAVEDIGGWREKNIKRLHWIAGLLLVGLGIAMILGLLYFLIQFSYFKF